MQSLQQILVPKDKFILLVDNRMEQRLIKINDNRQFKWRKTPIPIQLIAKYPYYQTLEVANQNLTAVDWDFGQPDAKEDNQQIEEVNNNKDIFEIGQAQKLQTDDIQRMKKVLKPSEIITGLIQNNQQFSKRTEYSKQKYLKKKERKYMFRIHAEPATLDTVHNYYFKNQHRSIGSIRWDMLGLMLLSASPFQNVLLSEQTKGILIGGILIRGAKSLTTVSKQTKNFRSFPIVQELNIVQKQRQKVKFTNWTDLISNKQARFDNFVLLGNYNFEEIIIETQSLLIEGCIITFFCLSLQPLEKAAMEMRKRGYLDVKIQDVWSRQYQVLENRTHPMMYMDSCSGYILTAFKVK